MRQQPNRRRFLQVASLAGVGYWVGGSPAVAQIKLPSEKLNIACIGIGHRGAANVKGVSGENIVALCDVDERQARRAWEAFPRAKRYADFRKMLDKMEREIDAVVVSTPDHTHAPATVAALELAKHGYCEKPLAHNLQDRLHPRLPFPDLRRTSGRDCLAWPRRFLGWPEARTGRRVDEDPNCPDAEKYLRREYRKGREL